MYIPFINYINEQKNKPLFRRLEATNLSAAPSDLENRWNRTHSQWLFV